VTVPGAADRDRPLAGRRIVTTRDAPGQLDDLLAEAGADVVHVPLIEVADAPDGGRALAAALAQVATFDWVVVTSRHGARRVGPAVRGTSVRTAAVGTATAAELEAASGRAVDLIPSRQIADALAAAFPPGPWRVLVAQADLAPPTLADALRARGCDVVTCVAYSTRLRTPPAEEVQAALDADAVAFASGSAARAWAAAIGPRTPPVVAAIGPTTASVAREVGLKVTDVAADHSVSGLAAILVVRFATGS
jgi:uroporphyrinogen-III synthase